MKLTIVLLLSAAVLLLSAGPGVGKARTVEYRPRVLESFDRAALRRANIGFEEYEKLQADLAGKRSTPFEPLSKRFTTEGLKTSVLKRVIWDPVLPLDVQEGSIRLRGIHGLQRTSLLDQVAANAASLIGLRGGSRLLSPPVGFHATIQGENTAIAEYLRSARGRDWVTRRDDPRSLRHSGGSPSRLRSLLAPPGAAGPSVVPPTPSSKP
jgi:hypothetical protein